MATYHELKEFKDSIVKMKKLVIQTQNNNEELLDEQESFKDKLDEIEHLLEEIKASVDEEIQVNKDDEEDGDDDDLHEDHED